MKSIKLVFDEETLRRYEEECYFVKHPKAKKKPIEHPYHPSINEWMIMKRSMMNAVKQKWKDFMVWFIEDQGYTNLRIEKCEMTFTVYYGTNRRHDVDNTIGKFAIDGLVEAGFVEDDSSDHIRSITLRCEVDKERPRTEILVNILEEKESNNG